jgi:hypothetical protein
MRAKGERSRAIRSCKLASQRRVRAAIFSHEYRRVLLRAERTRADGFNALSPSPPRAPSVSGCHLSAVYSEITMAVGLKLYLRVDELAQLEYIELYSYGGRCPERRRAKPCCLS